MTSETTRRRTLLKGISSRAWEHPADRGALVALRKLQGFDTILRKFSAFMSERAIRMHLLGSAVRVSERQFPRMNQLYAEAATVLDVQELPELYVVASPVFNAMTIGIDKPKIVVNSALVDLLDDDELRFVLGHELGHALSGHALYRTLLQYILTFGMTLASVPFGGIGLIALRSALSEWSRKSELSSDRAGLLATQDVQAAIRVNMKLASGGHLADLDQTEFLSQAHDYQDTEDLRDSIAKLILVDASTHPMNVVRASEIRKWVDSGAYARILSGEYPRRDGDRDAKISEEASAAADAYATEFKESEDALAKLARDLGDGISDLGKWVSAKVRGD
ncbi:Zn-dependent protease with chaperone function [Tessaracoccus bendigoensis DSM 12906]|uniref:Zn-dependent protease with chaperone function n=1 Tax=Tessaracoccus bendigoensis DSM 12906 TaxID=1123357 RepID=A0A1M6GMA9_9ACTN|nr:M48 family metallopeptidase [Tessaracoccus bendigoensis]SHJ11078.1 Zn-dependent protease with chaperone function [Tessaracoccus bendigoensis DSM 12906]